MRKRDAAAIECELSRATSNEAVGSGAPELHFLALARPKRKGVGEIAHNQRQLTPRIACVKKKLQDTRSLCRNSLDRRQYVQYFF
jgi:hypothetical protein